MLKVVNKRILFVVAHADDETLGAGATIAKLASQNNEIKVMSMTDGVGARGELDNGAKDRLRAAYMASKCLGFDWISQNSFPDNQLDTVPLLEVIKLIEKIKSEFNPHIIYTNSPADLNLDHRRVSEAVLTAFRPEPKNNQYELYTFEVPSSTDYGHTSFFGSFQPNFYEDIEKHWPDKISALKCYGKELKSPPHSRSFEGIENLARFRGTQVGLEMAEAFQLIRAINTEQ